MNKNYVILCLSIIILILILLIVFIVNKKSVNIDKYVENVTHDTKSR